MYCTTTEEIRKIVLGKMEGIEPSISISESHSEFLLSLIQGIETVSGCRRGEPSPHLTHKSGGPDRNRTCCLMLAKHPLYHVSYEPKNLMEITGVEPV